MNNLGEVVGHADTYTHYSHAFLYNGSTPLINLGSLAGDYSESVATAINNSGMVIGYTDTPGAGNPTHAFLYTTAGGMRDLGTLGGATSEAFDINNLSQIVGFANTANGSVDGFLYSGNGPMVDLGAYQAICINDAGEIAAIVVTGTQTSTYVSSGGTSAWINIGSLGGTDTQPTAMNTRGDVVGGSAITSANEIAQPFLYSGGTMTNLGTFGGQLGWANGINDSGVVVGDADLAGDTYLSSQGFVYYGSGAIENLNNLVDPSLGWTIYDAVAINDSGQIAASGYQQYGEFHAIVLTPVPEPESICLLIVAAFTPLVIKARGFANPTQGLGMVERVKSGVWFFGLFHLRGLDHVSSSMVDQLFLRAVCAIARSLRGKDKKQFVRRLRLVASSRVQRFDRAKEWLGRVVSAFRNRLGALLQTYWVGLTSSAHCIDARTRSLRFEGLECRALLTTATLVWNPSAVSAPDAVWTPTSTQDWLNDGRESAWIQNSIAKFPVSAEGAGPVAIADSLPGQQLIYASQIIIEDGANYSFVASTPTDQLQIPSSGTLISLSSTDTSPSTATITTPIVSQTNSTFEVSGSGTLDVEVR